MMKDIVGYEGLYAASTCGRIWSYKSQKFLSPGYTKRGYAYVCLYKDGVRKTTRVHRLVAEAFLPNPDNLTDVAHLDDCPSHNWLSNLAWKTHIDNMDTDSFRNKTKTKNFSRVRCVETGEIFKSCAQAAAAVGVVRQSINACLLGHQNTSGGYHWERVYEEKTSENK